MVRGSTNEMFGMIKAWYVPNQPIDVNSWNRGVRTATPGNIDAARMIPRTTCFPRNCSRASAYAVPMPTIRPIAVVTAPMIVLLTSALAKWLPASVENTLAKFSSVTWVGHGVVSNV